MSNPAIEYATTFTDSLVASGLTHACIAPGSRNTPLVLALARHRDAISLSSHLDERSAAFFALGISMAAGSPAAVVCTSGSAAANFFPAIVEAHQSRIPLIVLTADRPHELRRSGANQTIDQIKLYSEYADFFVDAPLPESNPPQVALDNLRTLAARAFASARTKRGVAHINLPFRKPFEPTADDDLAIDRRPPVQIHAPPPSSAPAMRPHLTKDLLSCRGMIYCGHGSARNEQERQALRPWLRSLSRVTGFPILAETTSNLRDKDTLGAYESWLGGIDTESVTALIRLGAPPLCKTMQDFLAGGDLRHHIHISRAGEWADDTHSLTQLLTINPASMDASEFDDMPAADDAWIKGCQKIEASAWLAVADHAEHGAYFDGAVAHVMAQIMPADGAIFAGSSLPVRHLDQFAHPRPDPPLFFANRGASGIDGNVSTALGIAMAREGRPMAALLGDITLYHDMNGLLAMRRCGVPMTIVLLNNGGGGIFQRLPAREHEPAFRDFLFTPHEIDFAQVAALYGLDYARADDRDSLRRAFRKSIDKQSAMIIEVRTDSLADLARRDEIMRAVRQSIAADTAAYQPGE